VSQKRISLGMKQLEPDPWDVFTRNYNPGDIIRGKVRSVTDYGVFVGIEEGVDGMVHKSDLSWTQRINNPADVYRKGDEVEAIILSINHEEKKVSLGIKQLYEDPWMRIPGDYPPGTMLEVRVINIADFGVFVELERGIEGLVPMSELSYDRVDDARTLVKEGQIVKAEIIDLNPSDRRITLSLKKMELEGLEAIKFDENRSAEGSEGRKVGPSGSAGATLGDLLKDKLGSFVSEGDEAAEAAEATEATEAAESAEATSEEETEES
jgi:small subunit ribosomal protein S1